MQEKIFLATEADAWYRRNREALLARTPADDPICRALRSSGLPPPRRVLEIGCANGYRLEWLRQEYGCDCVGVEPSRGAVEDGRSLFPNLSLHVDTAAGVGELPGRFDLVIFGFCLYLVERDNLFRIAHEVNEKLQGNGYIAIFDFHTSAALCNDYAHQDGVTSYKMDYAKLFDWNPQYTRIFCHLQDHDLTPFGGDQHEAVGTTILLKSDAAQAYLKHR
ncbi:MAG: class I SAM-dependent methyltransferase [Sphingomonadales bacterium]